MTCILKASRPPRLCGVLFTHKHSDHYSAARLKELQQARGPFSVIDESSPSYRGTTLLSLGTFNITRFPTVHDGPQFRNVPHVSYLIRSGDTALLFPGDADLRTTDKFAAILNFLGPHIHLYGFFNPYQMQCQAMWDLVDTCKFEKVYVNHLPRLEDDIYDLRGVVKYTCHHMPERKLIIPPEMSWVQIKEPVRSL